MDKEQYGSSDPSQAGTTSTSLCATRALALVLGVAAAACSAGPEEHVDAGAASDAPVATNATLAALTASAGVLDPPFQPEVSEYDLNLYYADAEVSFTPTAADPARATITVDGEPVASGSASMAMALEPGTRDVDIVVEGDEGSTTYTLHVRRGVDALASLELSYGDAPLTDPITPLFAPGTTSYALDVGLLLQRVQITVTPLFPDATITVDGLAVDAGVASQPIDLNLGQTAIPIVVQGAGGLETSYTVNVSRANAALQQAYAKASNTGADDHFHRVSLWGDTLAVGAPDEFSAATGVNGDQTDNNAPFSGAVYIFRRNGATWSQEAYLKASNTDDLDRFGDDLSLWGDTLAVGAPDEASTATGVGGNQDDNSAIGAGAVYVFTRTGTTWNQEAYIKASTTEEWDGFGRSVSVWGDTLAVGGRGDVHVFRRSGSTWSQEAFLERSNANNSLHFGNNVSLWGDSLAVSATGDASAATGVNGDQTDDSAPYSGAVFVFARSGTTWSQEAYLKASNTDPSDFFGEHISLRGDTLAVAAQHEASSATGINGNQDDNSAEDSGAVYLFKRNSASWSQEAYIKASNTDAVDFFGGSVSLWGDTLVVGAFREDSSAAGFGGNQANNSAASSGAVYVFMRAGTTWSQVAYVKASNPGAGDTFGRSVSVWGDTFVVGAYGEDSAATGVGGDQADNSATDSGAVYVFR